MYQPISHWSDLLMKHFAGSITPGEQEELDRQMDASPEKRKEFDDLHNEETFVRDMNTIAGMDGQEAWQAFAAKHQLALKNDKPSML